jgi:hypothetical protein
MSDPAMGDDVYQPAYVDYGRGENHTDVDLDNALDDKQTDEVLDEGYSPPEKPLAVDHHGVTASEQHERVTLDARLRDEVPDVGADGPAGDGIGDSPDMAGEPLTEALSGTDRAGRIVKDGYAWSDEPVARDVGIDGGAASAEEAAVHIVREGEEYVDEDYGKESGEPGLP